MTVSVRLPNNGPQKHPRSDISRQEGEKSDLCQRANQKAGKLYEDKDVTQFHGKRLWEERKRIPTHLFRAWYEGWGSMQMKALEIIGFQHP